MQRITIAAVKMANKETGFMLRSYERNSENKLAWACSVVHDTQFNLMGLVWLSYPFLMLCLISVIQSSHLSASFFFLHSNIQKRIYTLK